MATALSDYFSTSPAAEKLGLYCTCDPLADEHCDVCRNRHKLTGQAAMPYQKTVASLTVEGVSLSFKNNGVENLVLRDVKAKIRKIERAGTPTGRIVSFLGPSGIGKTQLLRILAGLQQPTTGNVFLGPQRTPVAPGLVGLVSQQYIIYRNRDILGNLRVAAMQREKMPILNSLTTYLKRRKQATEEALVMLERFGLTAKKDLYPAQLSGGQRQRVAIAQQLLCSDGYLLMDEPTAGLDPLSKQKVCQLVTEVANTGNGTTIIIVTHDIPTAAAISDTIWLMGRCRDAQGNIIPGAQIVDTYDLIECGLCWNSNVRRHPAYAPLVEELQERFVQL